MQRPTGYPYTRDAHSDARATDLGAPRRDYVSAGVGSAEKIQAIGYLPVTYRVDKHALTGSASAMRTGAALAKLASGAPCAPLAQSGKNAKLRAARAARFAPILAAAVASAHSTVAAPIVARCSASVARDATGSVRRWENPISGAGKDTRRSG